MRSPIIYPGGKGSMTTRILKYIPKHKTYLEPFFGGGSIFFKKQPCGFETINDINSDVINLFKTIRDKGKEFREYMELTPCSREIFEESKSYKEYEAGSFERAVLYFINLRQSFSAVGEAWGYSINNTDNRKKAQSVNRWLFCIKSLPEIIERLKHAQIENDDFEKAIKRFDNQDSFIYCDPPYLLKTRKSKKLYTFEMTDKDHERFLDACLNAKGKIMISGYNSDMYDSALKSWDKKEFNVIDNMSNSRLIKPGKRVEIIWMNYNIDKEDDLFLF